jgi:hypothetical protein
VVGTKRGLVVSLREGLREGCRTQQVTKLVGTEGESVVGTRWVPREVLPTWLICFTISKSNLRRGGAMCETA